MTKEEYVETLYIKGKKVDVGMDDYGQCYFFEYIDDDGEVQSIGCGTYNTHYLEEIYGHFDWKGTCISIWGQDDWDERIETLQKRYDKDPDRFPDLKNTIYRMKNDEYEIYDFEKMYRDREVK